MNLFLENIIYVADIHAHSDRREFLYCEATVDQNERLTNGERKQISTGIVRLWTSGSSIAEPARIDFNPPYSDNPKSPGGTFTSDISVPKDLFDKWLKIGIERLKVTLSIAFSLDDAVKAIRTIGLDNDEFDWVTSKYPALFPSDVTLSAQPSRSP